MHLIVAALLIGLATGLRSMTGSAVVSWAARLGRLTLGHTWLAFFGFQWTPWILTLMAIGEFIGDKLPSTPSRKSFLPFFGRIVLGGICGCALGANSGMIPGAGMIWGAIAGVIGAVAGTIGGYTARTALARAIGRDLPVALGEDLVAIGLAVCAVSVAA